MELRECSLFILSLPSKCLLVLVILAIFIQHFCCDFLCCVKNYSKRITNDDAVKLRVLKTELNVQWEDTLTEHSPINVQRKSILTILSKILAALYQQHHTKIESK